MGVAKYWSITNPVLPYCSSKAAISISRASPWNLVRARNSALCIDLSGFFFNSVIGDLTKSKELVIFVLRRVTYLGMIIGMHFTLLK